MSISRRWKASSLSIVLMHLPIKCVALREKYMAASHFAASVCINGHE